MPDTPDLIVDWSQWQPMPVRAARGLLSCSVAPVRLTFKQVPGATVGFVLRPGRSIELKAGDAGFAKAAGSYGGVLSFEAFGVDPVGPTDPTDPTEPVDPPMFRYGFSQEVDEGTAGDWFVSPGGSDTADGTLAAPFKTIGRAMAAASGGQVIRVRAGLYRETIDFTGKSGSVGAQTQVLRYGTEEVIVSGREPVTGWAACTSADQPIVGQNYASIYKVQMPLAAFVGGPRAAFLHEAGVGLIPSSIKAPFPFRPYTDNDMADWLVSDETVRDGSDRILGYRCAAITGAYTATQIMQAQISFHHVDNRASTVPIAGVVDGVILLSDQTKVYEGNSNRDRFALLNMPAALQRGEWAYTEDGSNVTLYIWPRNAANVTAGLIEYSARGSIVNVVNCEYVTVRGLILEGCASDGASTDGRYAIAGLNPVGSPKRRGYHFINCLIRDTWRGYDSYGAMTFRCTADMVIRNCSVVNAIGQTGLSTAGQHLGVGYGMDSNFRVEHCYFEGTDRASIRMFGVSNSWIAYCLSVNCGHAAHANKANLYENCSNVLWWSCIWSACGGYKTWQEASGIHTMFCIVPAALSADGRALNDQNRYNGDPQSYSPATQLGVDETGFICQNMLPPYKLSASSVNSLTAGKLDDVNAVYEVHNNIVNGAILRADRMVAVGNNAYTSGEVYDAATDRKFDLATVYEDVSGGDLRLREDSPTRAMTARSMVSTISKLRGLFPDFPWFTRDIAFNEFDPAAPFVGPYAPGSAQLPMPPAWVERGSIIGTAQKGQALTLTGGYHTGSPYPATTLQWIRSGDMFDTHSDIPGATGPTYVLQAEDVGKRVGVRQDTGSAVTTSVIYADVADAVAPIPFVPRGADFDGTAVFSTPTAGVLAGAQGMVSAWFKSHDTAWNALTGRRLFALEAGTTGQSFSVYTASGGRMSLLINNDSEKQTFVIYADPGNGQFQVQRWYHLAITWGDGWIRTYVDGVQVLQHAITSISVSGQTIRRFGMGGSSNGISQWVGALGHVWWSMDQALDLSVPANMAKLINGKLPADMGAHGELVTGSIPHWYYDGDGADWGQMGTASPAPRTGTLTASNPPPELP